MAKYDTDLFISYAHIDNQPLKEDLSGWISRFHASLEALLSMRMGSRVNIWRDDKLQGNDQFAEEITDQFDSTAALISVVSPRYLNSEWCAREVKAFCDSAKDSGGLVLKRKARIFKVIKSPIETEKLLPSIMQELLGYEFYKIEDGIPVEMDEVYGEQYGHDFNRTLNKLAFEIAVFLNDIKNEVGDTPLEPQSTNPVVYLAECSFDMKQYREVLGSELRRLGYTVLPDKQLPRTESKYALEVDDLLKQCQLSIHLVGGMYGVVPNGPNDKSTSKLQNEVAVSHCDSNALKRVIWIPDGIESEQMRQQNFIESLQTDPVAQRGAEVIVGSFEDLRTATEAAISLLEQQLHAKLNGQVEPKNEATGERLLYLLCTDKDRKQTVPIRQYFRNKGLAVSLPAFKGDAAEVRAINQHLMATADIVVVYYGAGDEAWKRSVDTEIRKLRGYTSTEKKVSYFTYLAMPSTCDKEDLIDMDEAGLINAIDGTNEALLNDWFESINTEPVES